MVTAILHTNLYGLLGVDGKLAYKSKADFAEFQRITRIPKSVLVLGRKTYADMGKITDRDIFVLSRRGNRLNNKPTENAVEDLILDNRNVFICGGTAVYNKYVKLCDRVVIHFTHQRREQPESWEVANYFDFGLLEDFKCNHSVEFEDFTQKIYVRN